MRHNFSTAVHELLRTFVQPFDPYRPELHYMRGPGPKYRAKQFDAATAAALAKNRPAPALAETAKAHA